MHRFLLIDGNNFLYAAQHAGRRLTAGELEVTAIFGFLGSLRNVMARFPGSTPIILWDSSPSWRVDIYPDYKGNRKLNADLVRITEALRPQRPIIKDIMRDMGVRQYSIHRQEADDLAADLSRKLSAKGAEVVLVTRDGDWQQLVSERVVWYDHKNNKVINLSNFHEETGYINPHRFRMGKIIHGDSSDNVPGVGGLGEGTAELILSEFEDLPTCVQNWDDFKKTIEKGSSWSRNKWRIDKAIEDPKLWAKYKLNTQLMDLSEADYPTTSYQCDSRYNEEQVHAHFKRLGFHSILRKYGDWIDVIKPGLVGVT